MQTHNYANSGSYDVVLAATNSCGTNSNTQSVNISDEAITVTGNITTNTTWYNTNEYLVSGFVYVKDGVTLTIQQGTLIKGEKSTKGTLIIERGGKLIANGTVNQTHRFHF
jgi:PKD repeat protein